MEIICPLAVFGSFVLLRINKYRIIYHPQTDRNKAHCLPFIVIVLQTEVCLGGGDLVRGVGRLPGAEPLHGAQHPPHSAQQVETGQDRHTQSAIRQDYYYYNDQDNDNNMGYVLT